MSQPTIVFVDEVHHVGWDIPTRILLDSNGHIWADNAHGSSDGFKGKEDLGHYSTWLAKTSDEEFAAFATKIRKHFNMKPVIPDWILAALHNGWAPPKNFDKDAYDWPVYYQKVYKNLP